MVKWILNLTLALCISCCLFVSQVKAETSTNQSTMSWRRGTAIVLFTGIGGGILGLSTLSFYGNPQEHTENITLGGLIGVVSGLGYVFYNSNQGYQKNTYDYSSLNFENKRATVNTDARQIMSFAFEF